MFRKSIAALALLLIAGSAIAADGPPRHHSSHSAHHSMHHASHHSHKHHAHHHHHPVHHAG